MNDQLVGMISQSLVRGGLNVGPRRQHDAFCASSARDL